MKKLRLKKMPKLGKFLFLFLIWAIGYAWYDFGVAGLVVMTIGAIIIFGWYYDNFDTVEFTEEEIVDRIWIDRTFFK